MKKCMLVISLISISGLSFAQNEGNNSKIDPPAGVEQSVFSIGFEGGFGSSFLMSSLATKSQPSWQAGISEVYSPWMHWGIGMGLNYSVEGNKTVIEGKTSTIELDYIRVPLKAIYFFRTYEHDFRPKVSFGPTLGFLVGELNSKYASSFDLGVNAALGFNYRLVRAIWLTADVNYNQGLLDVYANTAENELNGNVRMNLGLHFGF